MISAPLHTVVETPTFRRAAKAARITEAEMDATLDRIMTNPQAGDIVKKSGGVRKVRIGKEDMGKSGGYRVLTYFMDMDAPVFLLSVINKSDADNPTDAQTADLKKMAKAIKDARKKGSCAKAGV